MDEKDRDKNKEINDFNYDDDYLKFETENEDEKEKEIIDIEDYEMEEKSNDELNYNFNNHYTMEDNNNHNNYNKVDYQKHKRIGVTPFVFTALIAAIIGGLISSYVAPNFLYGKILPIPEIYRQLAIDNSDIQNITISPTDNISTVTAVAKKSVKSVVGITTIEQQNSWLYGDFETQGVGSGVIVDKDGYILTNSHVIGDGRAKKIIVQFENGDKEEGKVLWYEPTLDLAIIKVDGTNYPQADLGNSDNLQVGEIAVAIGNPLGLQFQRTVTSGIISGLNRTISDENMELENLIQTDASINPGNSGGPLINGSGEVIGINTAKITSAEGLGFSVPINIVKPIIDQVIEEGFLKTVYIGIQGYTVETYEKATGEDLYTDSGIIIVKTVENSPAYKAGLKPGDVIIDIDGTKVENMVGLKKILYNYKPEDSANINILRNRKEINIKIVFEQTPPNY